MQAAITLPNDHTIYKYTIYMNFLLQCEKYCQHVDVKALGKTSEQNNIISKVVVIVPYLLGRSVYLETNK